MPDQVEPNDVERIRVEGDLRLREMELETRKNELEFKKEKWSREIAKGSIWSLASIGPGAATILAAAIAVIGGIIGASITGYANLGLEREKLRSRLILKSVETRDPKEAIKMLRFFLDLGLLEDTTGAIAEYEKNPERIPLRPRAGWNDSGWDSGYDGGEWDAVYDGGEFPSLRLSPALKRPKPLKGP